jgi:hypothetical protein
MFASLTSKVVTAVCAVVGAIALLGTFFLTVTGGSPYLQFGLALIFFAMFIIGSYWWMVFGPGASCRDAKSAPSHDSLSVIDNTLPCA